jgi:sugar phosphate isomerase/epimerase
MAVRDDPSALPLDPGPATGRLGLDQPVGCWPTTPQLKSYEAAGFGYVQMRMPDRSVLDDLELVVVHARALRAALMLTGLRLILQAPDDLVAGHREHDRHLEGAISYAASSGARLLVYHAAAAQAGRRGATDRLEAEERSLRRLLRHAAASGVRIAIENMAPAYPGGDRSHRGPGALAELVDRLDSEYAGLCLDLGHAHIAACRAGCALAEVVEPVLDRVILFHVHDNFGADIRGSRPGGIEPLRLDLHLPPGAGSLPWGTLAPALAAHAAPLQLEIHHGRRLEPATLAILARELLGLGANVPRE